MESTADRLYTAQFANRNLKQQVLIQNEELAELAEDNAALREDVKLMDDAVDELVSALEDLLNRKPESLVQAGMVLMKYQSIVPMDDTSSPTPLHPVVTDENACVDCRQPGFYTDEEGQRKFLVPPHPEVDADKICPRCGGWKGSSI